MKLQLEADSGEVDQCADEFATQAEQKRDFSLVAKSNVLHWSANMVATGQGKVREIQGQGKVREFCAGSGKFEILRKVGEIQENPLKVREI